MTRRRISIFPPAERDIAAAEHMPETPQTRSPAYRLAFDDAEFLRRPELRPVRLQLELMKPEMILNDAGVESTVVLFGGARIPRPGETGRTGELTRLAHFYEVAREFSRLVSRESLARGGGELVVATGGGPGVMEAGNLGAEEVGARSIGLNIVLKHEPIPNAHVTPEFSFNFHYFGLRKMHFLMRARAVAVFPGGFGTLDELFETLTLIQTGRMKPLPVLLFGEGFWRKIIDWEALRDAGTIGEEDLALFRFVETAAEGWEELKASLDLAAADPA